MTGEVKFLLTEKEIPTAWYNLGADLPFRPEPPLHPKTLAPLGPEDLAALFPPSLIEQEMSPQRFIDIPGEVLDVYRQWRPTPLVRARRLERALQTPARVYYKYEGVSPAGSHKPNTAVAQAYYNRRDGTRRLTTETGAGQWGSALALACSFFDLECTVYMVRVSYEQKPYRKTFMRLYGAEVIPSPSDRTFSGRAIREADPGSPGSLGIAISEAVEDAAGDPRACYSLGSVLNHVLLHQTIIGLEARRQLEMAGERPDFVVGCFGGGSNFAGLAFPFVMDKINGKQIEIYPVEPKACPTLTRSPFVYDHGDTARYTPLLPMYSLGHAFVPAPIHAGGLRYHGMAPTVSQLANEGLIAPRAVSQTEAYQAGVLWARTEGVIPAPETSNALAQVVREAKKAKEEGKEKVIVFNFSGHGLLDLTGYEKYLSGQLSDYELSDDDMAKSTAVFADYPTPQNLKSR
ncbi:MAG TPA: TrpB-like pyridoxal phosphate-dependent enzyme [Clostridiales bacterium UBA8153]|nr:TrpB-like pyridoxal phosphate-dependent enzyme [Clostridiales bacterium UBA8153]